MCQISGRLYIRVRGYQAITVRLNGTIEKPTSQIVHQTTEAKRLISVFSQTIEQLWELAIVFDSRLKENIRLKTPAESSPTRSIT